MSRGDGKSPVGWDEVRIKPIGFLKKKIIKIFQDPLDKIPKVWYNKYVR